jgi:hypothetical protein
VWAGRWWELLRVVSGVREERVGCCCWLVAVKGQRRVQSGAVKCCITREANMRQPGTRRKPPLCNQAAACPELFPRPSFLHSHVSCSKTFLTTLSFNVKPSLLFAKIVRHVKVTMKEVYNHRCIESDTLHYTSTSKELGIIQQNHVLKDIYQRPAAGPHKPDPSQTTT